MTKKQSKFKKLLNKKILMGATVAAGTIFFIGGIIFWGGFNTAMEATNTMEFCIGCHEMENNVYKEYQPTIHYTNRTGVRAGCPDCHVPDPWVHKMVRKIQASNELYHKAMGTIDTPEKFEEHRLAMAKRVWKTMKETDSRECRNCHNFESMAPQFQKPRARNQHLNAFKNGQTCIDCHKGIAHNNVRHMLTDEELEDLEKPNPEFVREVPQMYIDGLELVSKQEADQKQKLLEDKEALEKAQQEQINLAVDEALEQYKSEQKPGKKSAKTTGASAKKQNNNDINVNWSKAHKRDITLFYPGETSIEWVLNGRDHGGARPFAKGAERCVTCHDAETSDMGEKMVSGEKAESRPIPGKRGSIPVKVESSHDGEYLYMRFSWADTKHVPVGFVEGGKMDPENPVKLAMMFSTDEVEYADRSGCWGACHHDAKDMPHAPEQGALDASALKDKLKLSNGVSKYIKESRSKIEIKGRRGKKRGGWDKLITDAELSEQINKQHFMDIIRFKSGSKVVEDGSILSHREMLGGQGATFNAKLKSGKWTVEMKRKLKSESPGDISLELSKVYNFGFAIHDDYSSSRFHHVSLGYKLGFDNTEVELNAVKQ